jgi:hypothetical protein
MGIYVARRGLLTQPKIYTGLVILAFAAVRGFGDGACEARGTEISGAVRLLSYLGFPVLMTYWLRSEGKISGSWRVWDSGLFL